MSRPRRAQCSSSHAEPGHVHPSHARPRLPSPYHAHAQPRCSSPTHATPRYTTLRRAWLYRPSPTHADRHVRSHRHCGPRRASRSSSTSGHRHSSRPSTGSRDHADLFATSETARLPTYVSPLPDPAAWRVDALFHSWTDPWGYLFPPFPLIGEVLQRIPLCHCQAILTGPAWPSQPWLSPLLSLLDDHPRCLPLIRTFLREPQSQIFHPAPSASLCTRGGYQVSPRSPRLLLAGGSPLRLFAQTLYTVSLRQQMAHFHRVVQGHWTRSIHYHYSHPG